MSKNEIREHNIRVSKIRSTVNKAAALKECFFHDYPDQCSEIIISAHSLQRTGALTLLESDKRGNKKVYALTEREYSETS
ncbi:MAG TPA: hypothetical protein DCR04_02755 [Flavobacteriales bacterium]|nr:hypothetical protein [Flavobacteriales bacterium]